MSAPLDSRHSDQTIDDADASARPSAGTGSPSGSVGGETLTATDCIGSVQSETALGNSHLRLYVVISDTAGVCAALEAGHRALHPLVALGV